jgi:hypothetical protein
MLPRLKWQELMIFFKISKQTTTPRSDQRQRQTINHLLLPLILLKHLAAYPGFIHTVDQKWTAFFKVMGDINAPDYAFGLIFAWARGASADI